MLIPHLTDRGRIEVAFFLQAFFIQKLLRPVTKGAPKPMLYGHAKPFFGPVHQRFWYIAIEDLAHQPLPFPITTFESSGNTPGKLHKTVVQQWHASFQTSGHTSPV